MKASLKKSLQFISIFILIGASPAWADGEIKGRIEAVNQSNKTIVVDGITFYVTKETDYDGGLQIFDDFLKEQKVEIDFQYQDGKHFAVEIELED
jgi:hypothetical protein